MSLAIRFVRITFGNGTVITGIVPATVTDAELDSIRSNGVDLVFSDPHAAPRAAPIARLLDIGERATEQRLAS